MVTMRLDAKKKDPEIVRNLEEAISNGDLGPVASTLTQWPYQPTMECIDDGPEPRPSNFTHDPRLWPFELSLSMAIKKDKAEIVSYVLDQGLPLRSHATYHALDVRSIEVFQALLDHGWDINAPVVEHGCPPLNYLVTNEPLVRWFLSHGADPDAWAPLNARTPVSSACASSPSHIVKLFYECNQGASLRDTLHCAAESRLKDRLPIMEYLIEKGADLNALKWEQHGRASQIWTRFGLGTPLHHAVKGGYVDRVELLLSREANVAALDSNGQTALEVARQEGSTEMVNVLVGHSQ